MAGKHGCRWTVLVLLFSLLIPGTVFAGPFFGDWGWLWHPAHDEPHGVYSPLHYWAPYTYKTRALVHPSKLDQYPPGPTPPVPPSFEFQKYHYRMQPPMPSSPYANPSGYYGRPIVPGDE
jgi:hypothetical protein